MKFKYILVVIGVILISVQWSFAQTAEELSKKPILERKQVIDKIVVAEIEKLVSKNLNGKLKPLEILEEDRRLANTLRAFFTDYGKDKAHITGTLYVIRQIRDEENAKISISDILLESVYFFLAQYFPLPMSIKEFDAETDEKQVLLLRTEEENRIKAKLPYIFGRLDLETQFKELRKAKEEMIAARDDLEETQKRRAETKKKREEIAMTREDYGVKFVVEELKLSFRALTVNSQKMVLTLSNETKIASKFHLKCNVGSNTEKSLAISMPANSTKKIGFAKDKFSFILGERCGFYYNNEEIRKFTVEM